MKEGMGPKRLQPLKLRYFHYAHAPFALHGSKPVQDEASAALVLRCPSAARRAGPCSVRPARLLPARAPVPWCGAATAGRARAPCGGPVQGRRQQERNESNGVAGRAVEELLEEELLEEAPSLLGGGRSLLESTLGRSLFEETARSCCSRGACCVVRPVQGLSHSALRSAYARACCVVRPGVSPV